METLIWVLIFMVALVFTFIGWRIGSMMVDEASTEFDAGPAPECLGATASVPYENEVYTEVDWMVSMGAQPDKVWDADGKPVYDGRFAVGQRDYLLRKGLMKEGQRK